jgi:hypothetical protein
LIFVIDEDVLYFKCYEQDFDKIGWKMLFPIRGLSDLEVYLFAKQKSANYIITNNRKDFKKIAPTFQYQVKIIVSGLVRPSSTIVKCIKIGISDNKDIFSIGYYASHHDSD